MSSTILPVLPRDGALRPLGLDEVRLTSGFWADRQAVNASASIPHCDHWEERVGWVENFRLAVADGGAGLPAGRRGREFSDSDVYKMMEAMAWEIGRTGDAALEARFAELTALIGAVQEADGYLNTKFGRPGQQPRYCDLEWGHELYCYGHLLQAAVARLRTGHDDEFVAIARRAADHVCATFGPDGIQSVCGHPEIEPALVEFARATGEPRYTAQAALFVDRRGTGTLPEIEFGATYFQDDVPVREATVLRGHAVRALYLSAGAIDVAVETGDAALLDAVAAQYARTLARRTYLTGGMGSHHQDEAYGADHELPPDRAYCETCAGVASGMVSWRLLLASGEDRWADAWERAMFNVVATSPAADGRSFFYTNPLHQRTPGDQADPERVSPRALSTLRAPWFEVSCCPTNVARTLASFATYIAAVEGEAVRLLQYAPATVSTTLADGRAVGLAIETGYPHDGRVLVRVTDAPGGEWELGLRVPAWADGATLDGVPVAPGTARVRREFAVGDEVVLDLPMAPRFTRADERVDAVRGALAVERGPLVLCLESVDLPGGLSVHDVALDAGAGLVEDEHGIRARGVRLAVDDADWPYAAANAGAPGPGDAVDLPLVPYHSWANRGPATMRIWLPTTS